MDLTRRRLLAVLLASPLALRAQDDGSLPVISKAEEERLKKFLPRTFAKLLRREPVYVAVCGDEISSYSAPGMPYTAASHVMAWYGRFLDRLGSAFYYHGGVQDVRPPVPGASAALEQKWAEYRKLRAEWEKTRQGDPPPIPGVPVESAGGPRAELSVSDILRVSQPADVRVPVSNAFYAASYTSEGAVAVQILDPLRSQVYHTEETAVPDIVFIGCGARDALEGASLATLRTVLETAIAECRAKGSDVILAGPPPTLDEADERAAMGRARPWAAVMREVAEAAGIFFADLGAAAVHQPSDLLNRTIESAFRSALPPVRALFDHGPKVQNSFHPNSAAHIRMGERAADWLRHGEPARPWEISGWLALSGGENGEDVMVLRVASKSAEPLTVAVCPLRFTGWSVQPGWPDKVHTFEPGRGARRFKFPVVRNADPQPGHEPFVRGSVLLIDDDAQHLADVKIEIRPLALLWPEERADGAGAAHLLKCTLVNTDTERELDAALELDWLGAKSPLPPVKLAPGKSQPVVIQLPLPPPGKELRFRQTVTVRVSADGHSWPFTRRIEGVRHLGLNQKIPLIPMSRWRTGAGEESGAPAPLVTISANQSGIFLRLEVPSAISSDDAAEKPWGRLEVQLDGRKAGDNGTLGSIGRVLMDIPRSDERSIRIPQVRSAVFGVRSDTVCHADSIVGSSLTQPDGSRRIEFNMKRGNLFEHEWSLDGFGQNDLGINLRLLLYDARTGGFSDAKTWVLSASAFPWADARSLTALELRADPAQKWSLRIA